MKRVRKIYNSLMRAVKEGSIPFGYYGPETCRWATPAEMRRFGLKDCPMVHLDESGEIDCYFTETGATVVVVPGASHLCPQRSLPTNLAVAYPSKWCSSVTSCGQMVVARSRA